MVTDWKEDTPGMAKASDKKSAKTPFMVLTRRATAGWLVAVFVISAWMFGVGVLVGRGTMPVQFDLDRIKRTLDSLKKSADPPRAGQAPQKPVQMKEKTALDFYEALPKNREDAEMPNLPKAPPEPAAPAKPEPPARKPAEPPAPAKPEKPDTPPPPPAATAAPPSAYTVQIAAVRTEEEARRYIDRLRQKGYAAHLEPTAIPDKGTWYRVRMGEFPSKEGARGTLARLKKDGFESVVVPK